MKLTALLAETKAKNIKAVPTDKLDIMLKSTAKLKADHLSNKAIKIGDKLPDFKLPNSHGKIVSLKDYNNDFLVISFYRGGWCPYCNLELKALQNIVPELSKLSTDLIAITPETPDNSLTTSEKNKIDFSILSDNDNNYAKELRLTFKMPQDLQAVYKSFNLNVDEHNGNKSFELPMPATYIVNKNKEVIYSFVPEDYTERLDPEIILDTIKKQA